MRYSYSKIATFKDCPLRFKYAYIDNIKPKIPNSMLRGNFMHSILENIGKDITYERFEYVLKNISWPLELPESEVKSAISSVDKWFNLERFRDVVAVEKAFSIRLEGFELTGRIDRIDRLYDKTFSIIDYKTGYFNDYDGLQLQIYALVGYRLYDADDIVVKYEFIDRNETVAKSIQREQAEEFSKVLIGYMSEIEMAINSNYFPPYVSQKCRKCVFNDICSAYNKMEDKHE
jgi:RecB family exonuclease